MPESVQSCFELSIHLSVSEQAVNCSKISSREKKYREMESSKHDWTLSLEKINPTEGTILFS